MVENPPKIDSTCASLTCMNPDDYADASQSVKDPQSRTRFPSNPLIIRVPFFLLFSFNADKREKRALLGYLVQLGKGRSLAGEPATLTNATSIAVIAIHRKAFRARSLHGIHNFEKPTSAFCNLQELNLELFTLNLPQKGLGIRV